MNGFNLEMKVLLGKGSLKTNPSQFHQLLLAN